jgi:hypothetical protein
MNDRNATRLAVLLLVLQPLLWLWPFVVGDRLFVPYDTAQFPPASLQMTPAEHAAVKSGKNHDVTEVPAWFLPEFTLAGDELRAGRLPTWNPHARGGAPLHAHGLLGLCYPPNWIALLAEDPAPRLGWLCWLSLTIAGLLLFGLLREVGLSVQAAWFGAMVFQLGAPMAVNAFFWMRLASLIWLPGLLWALLRLARPGPVRPGPFAAVAVTLALPWLAGFPPFATTSTLIGGLFGLRLVAERLARDGTRAARHLALRLLAAGTCGVLLAMPQLLPSLQFFPQSARDPSPTIERITTSRFDTYGLLGYVLPDAFGHPTAAETLPYGKSPLPLWLCDRADENGRGALPNYNYTEYSVFFGALPLLLAGYGIVRGRGHLRWFWNLTLLLLLGLALMLPGVHWLYHLPVFKNVWPMRWLVPAALPLAWFAAIGLDRLWLVERRSLLRFAAVALALAALVFVATSRPAAWLAAEPTWLAQAISARTGHPPEVVTSYVQEGAAQGLDRFAAATARFAMAGRHAALWLAGSGLVLLAFALLEHRPRLRQWLLRTALAATALQLALHGQPLLRGIERSHDVQTPVHTFLREQAAAQAATGGFTIARGALGEVLQIQLPPGQLFAPGIRDLHFYSHFDGRSIEPLQRLLGGDFGLRNCAKGYLTTALPDVRKNPMPGEEPLPTPPFPHPLQHPLLDLLGVRYVLATQELAHAGRRVGPTWRGPGGEFFVYERQSALPRAFVVPELQVLADDEAVLKALVDPSFAPRQRALVTVGDAPLPADTTAGSPGERPVRFVSDLPAAIELEVPAGPSTWLVLTDTFLPGWSATIDGAPVPIHRANHALRLVRLPPQACRVRFVYDSPGLVPGLALAGIGTLGLLVLVVATARRPRRLAPGSPAAA